MKGKDENKPELRVLDDDIKPARLEVGKKMPELYPKHIEQVEVLKADEEAKLKSKTFEPDISNILDDEPEEIDSEAGWGSGFAKAPPLGWFVLAAVILCALAMWATVTLFKAQPVIEEVIEEKKELAVDIIKEEEEVRQTLDLMRNCAREYLLASTIEEILPHVRHSQRVKTLMEKYYQTHSMKPEEFSGFLTIRALSLDSQSFVYTEAALKDGTIKTLLMEQTEDGNFLVDWESDVCYLPIAWEEFIEKKPTEPLNMRVFIAADYFYAYEFSDESIYDCYKLMTRDVDNQIFGFVKKGSKPADDINRFLARAQKAGSQNMEPLILRLRFPKNSHSKKCVWIDSVVAEQWIYVKPPDQAEPNEDPQKTEEP